MRTRHLGRSALVAMLVLACAPRVGTLAGVAPVDGSIPAIGLAHTPRRVTFTWELNDGEIVARGDGVARIAPPDSARVDLFLGGGFGAAAAILIGDSLVTPPGAGSTVRLVPPAPLLWAALGRVELPALADTVIRVQGDTLRATIGNPVRWRLTAVANVLQRLDRVAGDRIVEFVARDGAHVHYELSGRRSLTLTVTRDTTSTPFDASIWHF